MAARTTNRRTTTGAYLVMFASFKISGRDGSIALWTPPSLGEGQHLRETVAPHPGPLPEDVFRPKRIHRGEREKCGGLLHSPRAARVGRQRHDTLSLRHAGV